MSMTRPRVTTLGSNDSPSTGQPRAASKRDGVLVRAPLPRLRRGSGPACSPCRSRSPGSPAGSACGCRTPAAAAGRTRGRGQRGAVAMGERCGSPGRGCKRGRRGRAVAPTSADGEASVFPFWISGTHGFVGAPDHLPDLVDLPGLNAFIGRLFEMLRIAGGRRPNVESTVRLLRVDLSPDALIASRRSQVVIKFALHLRESCCCRGAASTHAVHDPRIPVWRVALARARQLTRRTAAERRRQCCAPAHVRYRDPDGARHGHRRLRCALPFSWPSWRRPRLRSRGPERHEHHAEGQPSRLPRHRRARNDLHARPSLQRRCRRD